MKFDTENTVELRDFLWSLGYELIVEMCQFRHPRVYQAYTKLLHKRDINFDPTCIGFGSSCDIALRRLAEDMSRKTILADIGTGNRSAITNAPPLKCSIPWKNKNWWKPVIGE
jgi:hypothetical protein